MIDPIQFDETLRRYIKAEQFCPFCVELKGAERIWIRQPAFAFGGGAASFIDPQDGALVGFCHEDVVGFHSTGV